MNIFIDYHSRTPIYEQIKEQIVLDINRGVLKADEQLPSLRQMSAQLGLNINTVKRAFSELEAQGITYSVAGKGIFINADAQKNSMYLQQALNDVETAAINAKTMGADREQLLTIINELFKGDESND